MNLTQFLALSFSNKLALMSIIAGMGMVALFGIYLVVGISVSAYYNAKLSVMKKYGLLDKE